MVAVVNQRSRPGTSRAATRSAGGFWLGESRSGAPIEIVGMTRDAKYADLRSPTRPTVYIPIRQAVPGQASFAVRTGGDPLALAPVDPSGDPRDRLRRCRSSTSGRRPIRRTKPSPGKRPLPGSPGCSARSRSCSSPSASMERCRMPSRGGRRRSASAWPSAPGAPRSSGWCCAMRSHDARGPGRRDPCRHRGVARSGAVLDQLLFGLTRERSTGAWAARRRR